MTNDARNAHPSATHGAVLARGFGMAVLPLPTALEMLRPDFLVLEVLYRSIESPRTGGLTLAFVAGLALDVIRAWCSGSMRSHSP